MNNRDNDRPSYRERNPRTSIGRPERGTPPLRSALLQQSSTPPNHEQTPQPPADPTNLAQARREFGFDDIPVDEDDMEQVRFRDIIRAWARQTLRHSPLEEKLKNNSRLKELKNDLKWAIQADLDEPVKPVKKQPKQTPPPNVISDKTTAATPPIQAAETLSKTIDININFGSLPKLPPLRKSTKLTALTRAVRGLKWSRRHIIVASVVAVAAVGIAAGGLYFGSHSSKTAVTTTTTSNTAKTPEYTTLLPTGKSIDTLGGWHRVSPPDRDPVFAYADKIDGVPVNISQQPLPDDFKTDKDKNVAELAKSFNATEKIESGGTTVYIGTSSKGPQSAIFAKEDTLILMKSQAKISNDAWAAYVESLK